MILRRVIKHVRNQEWTAIGIDFLIVVIGVFVGLQVANWNDGQADQRRGQDYVERLTDDIRRDIRDRGNTLAYYEAVNDSAERTIELLNSPSPNPQELVVNAYRATEYSHSTPRRATWDEIVSSGEIGLLPEAVVENALAIYYTYKGSDQARQSMLGSAYRKRVRRTIPHKVQLAIRNGCGDVRDEIGNITGFQTECALNLSDTEILQAADALLSDPEILPDLRLHFSNISGARGDLGGEMRTLNRIIRMLEGNAPDPVEAPAP